MPKKSSSDKGVLGFFYGGVLKMKVCMLFSCEGTDPQEVYDETRKYFGRYVTCKYVLCENQDTLLEKFKTKHKSINEYENLFNESQSEIWKSLKELAGVTKGKTLREKPEKEEGEKKTKKGDASDNEDASGDEVAEAEEEEEEEEVEEKTKSIKSTKGKKDKVEDEDENEKPTKSSKSTKSKKDKVEVEVKDTHGDEAEVEKEEEEEKEKEEEKTKSKSSPPSAARSH